MRCRRAFTVIELLVVVAIISIVAAILFPVFASAKSASKASVCVSNTKQLGLAIQLYQQDFDDWFPIGGWDGKGPPSKFGPYSRWYIDLLPYTRSEFIRLCPARSHPSSSLKRTTHYGLNVSLSSWENAVPASIIVNASGTVMVCDTTQYRFDMFSSSDELTPENWSNYDYIPSDWQVVGPTVFGTANESPYTVAPDTSGDELRRPFAVHPGNRVNVGFIDGHAKSVTINALIGPMPKGWPFRDPRNFWDNF